MDMLLCEGEALKVTVPDIDSILGDKLTAFAPHTSGIPIDVGKNMEIMKQMYDISSLISEFNLYGHIHMGRDAAPYEEYAAKMKERNIPYECYNVGCMMPYMDYTPRTLEEIRAGRMSDID